MYVQLEKKSEKTRTTEQTIERNEILGTGELTNVPREM